MIVSGTTLTGGNYYDFGNYRLAGSASTNTAQTYTRTGTPTTVTTPTPVLGTSSGNFTSAGAQYISTTSPTPTMTNFGTGNFTFEAWIRLSATLPAARELFSTEVTNGFGVRLGKSFNSATVNAISLFARSGPDQNWAPFTWTTNTWTFIAIQRQGTNISFWAGTQGQAQAAYLGGASYTTATSAGFSYGNATSTGVVVAGYATTANSSLSYINEICISNVARYTQPDQAIPIPTNFFGVDQYTTQLLHFQGANGGTTFTNQTS